MKRVLSIIILATMIVSCMSACGSKFKDGDRTEPTVDYSSSNVMGDSFTREESSETSKSGDLFIWEGNKITALTEEGKAETDIVIPDNCEEIGFAVFTGSAVKNITFADDDDVEITMAFNNCKTLESITLPKNLSKIGMSTFECCDSLKSISIPEAVSILDKSAFNACPALEEVTFEGTNIESIGAQCFFSCDSLKSIEIPEGVETIGDHAFMRCTSLVNVGLPSTIKSIEKFAFVEVDGIESISLKEEVSDLKIDGTAFGMRTSLMDVHVAKGSWCDTNRDSWDVGFKSIIAE